MILLLKLILIIGKLRANSGTEFLYEGEVCNAGLPLLLTVTEILL